MTTPADREELATLLRFLMIREAIASTRLDGETHVVDESEPRGARTVKPKDVTLPVTP